jgi:hypothetical protein
MEFALGLGTELGVPWVSANLRLPDGSSPFPRHHVVEVGGVRVLVTGVLPPDPIQDPRLGVQVLPPEAAVLEVLEQARTGGTVDLVVCLSTLGMPAEQRLARAVPGIHIIIGGGDLQRLQDPYVVGDTAIFHAADRGRFMGIIELSPDVLGTWRAPRTPHMKQLLEDQQAALQRTLAGEKDPRRRAALEAQQRSLTTRISAFDATGTQIEHRLMALNQALGEDPEIAGWVSQWKQAAAKLQRPPPPRPTPRPPRSLPAPPAASATGPYAGTGTCRPCHAPAYRNWSRTPHARAYAALRGKPRATECLECHATRLQRAGGTSLEPIVGCETCHGPGGQHNGPANIIRTPTETTCRTCHRGHHPDETFDFPTDYDRIRCDRELQPGSVDR